MSNEETKLKSAAEAVAAVMCDIRAVGKDDKTSGGGPSYRYRGIDGLINGIAPAMHEHGLILVPHVMSCEIVPMAGRNGWTETRMHIEYDVVGPDGSTLPRPVRTFAIGADNGDKGPGKAMSYGYKSAVAQLLCIPTMDPTMDNEATAIPDAEPVISAGQVAQLRDMFLGIEDDDERAEAKTKWMAQVGDPRAILVRNLGVATMLIEQIIEELG